MELVYLGNDYFVEKGIRVSYDIKRKGERKRGQLAKREKTPLSSTNPKSCILLSF
jgi:hypothetical protein